VERRLSAIFSADVVGYSRLMAANEVRTLIALNKSRSEILDPAVADHRGRIVKEIGDGVLVEFPSAVSAVECAVRIQSEMAKQNGTLAEDRKLVLRIGVHLGDVIVQGEDIFGEGVNLASRIEGVALPGGVAVSAVVRDNVGNRLELAFEDRGEFQLKNIDQPVRIFYVVSEEPANVAASEGPIPLAPFDRPSIAVLPFNNLSNDAEQEYFSDGICEDIITDLSKISSLFVIGRNTSFTYRGAAIQLQRAARELGVRYLLEGSVRKSGNRVRINAQLIDGTTGGHLWAERYDRELTDIFAIQDEITSNIVARLKVHLLPAELELLSQAPTEDVSAYTEYLRGRRFYHFHSRRFLKLAREQFVAATIIDPKYAQAHAAIASCEARLVGYFGEDIDPEQILARANRALDLQPELAEAHAARANALTLSGKSEEARSAFETALEYDPNSFEAHYAFGLFCLKVGDCRRAADLFERALELDPEDFQSPFLLLGALDDGNIADDHRRAFGAVGLQRAEEQLRRNPESSRAAQLGANYLAAIGETARAREWIERALMIDSDDPHANYNAACAFALLGEHDKALDHLEKWAKVAALDSRSRVQHDSDFVSIRHHPRFVAVIDSISGGGLPA
jgi:adenylate cyclase